MEYLGSVQAVVPPITVEVSGCLVEVLEVNRYTTVDGKVRYLVSCRIICGDKSTGVFTVDARDNRELLNKLRSEVSRFKIYILAKS